MANQTPLSTILALFGSTCHYLEVTTKALVFFPPYVANSSPMALALMLVNSVLAVGYGVFGWHALGWIGKLLRWTGTSFERVHDAIADRTVRGLRYGAGLVMRAARAFLRWLR